MRVTPLMMAAGVFLGFGTSASAQVAGRVEMIPKDVAEDLMGFFTMMGGGMGMDSASTITLGRVAHDIEGKIYLPATTRVLASTGALFSTTVLQSTLSRDSTVAAFRREMARLGWKPVKDGPNQGGGFAPAPTAARDTIFSICNAATSLVVTARATANKETRVILLSVPQPAPECQPPTRGRADMMASMNENRMPTLINPPGSDRRGCGGSNFGGNQSSRASIATTMSDEELLDHYAKQLTDSGWTLLSPRPVSRNYVRTDSTGLRREIEIAVGPVVSPTNCRSVDMQMKRYR